MTVVAQCAFEGEFLLYFVGLGQKLSESGDSAIVDIGLVTAVHSQTHTPPTYTRRMRSSHTDTHSLIRL